MEGHTDKEPVISCPYLHGKTMEKQRERVHLKWEIVQPLFKLQTHRHTTYSYLLKPPASKQATKTSNQHCVVLSLPSNSFTHNFSKSLHQQTISFTKSQWSPKPNKHKRPNSNQEIPSLPCADTWKQSA